MALYVNIPPSIPGSDWFALEAAAHAQFAQQMGVTMRTLSDPMGLSNDLAALGTNALDAAREGGALRGTGAAGTWVHPTKASIYQNLATSKFVVSFQARLSAIAVSQASYIGLKNLSSGHQLVIGTDQSVAGGATDFIAFAYNGVALTNIPTLGTGDTNKWTFRFISDGTTVTLQRCAPTGGAAALSSGTILTAHANFPAVSAALAFSATTGSSGQSVYGALYSYVED